MYKNREELPGGLKIGDYILIADLKKGQSGKHQQQDGCL